MILAQPAAHHLGKARQRGFQHRAIRGVFVISVLVTDRLRIGVGADVAVKPAAGIQAARLSRKRQPPLTETAFEKGLIELRQVTDFTNPEHVQTLFRHFTDAWNFSHIDRREKVYFLAWN